jgi:hypothetical protein
MNEVTVLPKPAHASDVLDAILGKPAEPADALQEMFGHGANSPEAATLADVARAYLKARKMKDEADELAKMQGVALDRAEEEFRKQAEAAGVKSIKVEFDNLTFTVSTSKSDYYAVPPGALDDNNFVVWMMRSGGQDLIKRTVHHASFSSHCRELVAAGKTLFPNLKVTEKKTVRVAKG